MGRRWSEKLALWGQSRENHTVDSVERKGVDACVSEANEKILVSLAMCRLSHHVALLIITYNSRPSAAALQLSSSSGVELYGFANPPLTHSSKKIRSL